MKLRDTLVAAALATLAAACGKDSCPTTAAYPKSGQTPGCTGAPAQVQIGIQMCEACSHTSPSCSADLSALGSHQIFLDTRWEVCTDQSSCASQACSAATCQFSVPAGGYTVQTLSPTGTGTSTFQLNVTSSSAACTGQII